MLPQSTEIGASNNKRGQIFPASSTPQCGPSFECFLQRPRYLRYQLLKPRSISMRYFVLSSSLGSFVVHYSLQTNYGCFNTTSSKVLWNCYSFSTRAKISQASGIFLFFVVLGSGSHSAQSFQLGKRATPPKVLSKNNNLLGGKFFMVLWRFCFTFITTHYYSNELLDHAVM